MSDSIPLKVSVCIPVFNGSDYIAESIDSVLSQTYEDFQLVVCDNCSTDNTEEIVRSFRDARLKYVRNAENLGLVGNFNRCLEHAKGEYVCIWHHDDVMLPDNLKLKVQLLEEHPDVGFVHSNLVLIDEKGAVVAGEIWYEGSRHDYIEDGRTAVREYLQYLPSGASIFIGAVLARRSHYEKVGEFNPALPHCVDSDMWMRMMLLCKIACIGTPLVKYRVHSTSASSHWGDYASVPYIKEHYLAATIFFNRHPDQIPQVELLKSKTYLAFGETALNLSNNAMGEGDFRKGKALFKESLSFSPRVVTKSSFWKTALKTAIGASGVNAARMLKANLCSSSQ